ncbi:MAG: hypothetical protein M3421_04630 [Bacteroidota bacterium]|nr:hypothetical protein [Bacteroidota bacterium]
MIRLTIITCLLLLTNLYTASAKKNPEKEEWNNGTLVLKNKETLSGKIYYNVEYDLVQIKLEDQIKTFSPHTVHYFQYFDEAREIKRLYAALEKKPVKHKKSGITFYEVLLGGELVLLRKEEKHFIPEYEILFNTIDLVPSMASNHYVLVKGNLVSFQNFQKDILPLMADHAEDIESFIKRSNLYIHDFVDQILIIDYYNFLKDPFYKRLEDQIVVKE